MFRSFSKIRRLILTGNSVQAATCPDSRARTVPSNLSEPCPLPRPLRSIIGASAGLGALSSSTYERIAGFSISPAGLDEGPPVRVGVAGPARPPGRGCRTPRRGSADTGRIGTPSRTRSGRKKGGASIRGGVCPTTTFSRRHPTPPRATQRRLTTPNTTFGSQMARFARPYCAILQPV